MENEYTDREALGIALDIGARYGGHGISRIYSDQNVIDAKHRANREGLTEPIVEGKFFRKLRQAIGGTLLGEAIPGVSLPVAQLTEMGKEVHSQMEKDKEIPDYKMSWEWH